MKLIVNLSFILILFILGLLISLAFTKFNNLEFFYIIKILIILIFVFLFYFLSLVFLNYEWKLSVLFCSAAILLSIYTFEIYLKVKNVNINPYIFKAQQLAKSIDKRSKYETIIDFRSRGIRAHTSINPLKGVSYEAWIGTQGRDFFPLSGISNTLTIMCNELSYWSHYKSDKFGFNNPNKIYKDYQNKKIDAVLIGDSFVHGACVKENKDLASILRNNNLKVINFGYSANGPLTELATLMEYAINFKPENVFWFYFRGDISDLHKEYAGRFLPKYIDKNINNSLKMNNFFSQNLINRQIEIDQFLINYINKEEKKLLNKDQEYGFKFFADKEKKIKPTIKELLIELFNINEIEKTDLKFLRVRHLIGLINKSSNECLDFNCSHYTTKEFPEIIDQARKIVESWEGKFHFVYLPSWWEYSDYKKNYLKNKNEIINIIDELNINILDFDDYLTKTKNPLDYFAFSLPNHYNNDGYNLLSEQIHDYLLK